MRSFRKTSLFTMDITEEDGTVNEWIREAVARDDKKNEYDYNNKLKIGGYWYVTAKDVPEPEDGDED